MKLIVIEDLLCKGILSFMVTISKCSKFNFHFHNELPLIISFTRIPNFKEFD